jgi:hypothetical protein
MRRLLWLIPLVVSAADVSPQTYLAEVRYLASPELKGRATGSPELEKAADYIAGLFKSFGLQPADGKNFEEAFPVTLGAHLGPNGALSGLRTGVSWAGTTRWQPYSFSSSGSVAAPVAFAGYGITDKEKHYDDYAGIDVTGKVVLILRHEPREGKELSSHSALTEKAVNAKMHGAKAVLLVNDIYAHGGAEAALDKFQTMDGPTDIGILFAQITPALA